MSTLVKTPSTDSSSGGGGSAVVQTTQLSSQPAPSNSRSIELTTVSHNNSSHTTSDAAASSDVPRSELIPEKGGTESGAGEKATPAEEKGTTATTAATQEDTKEPKILMYPEDLQRILTEVAQSGASSVLRWMEEESSRKTPAAGGNTVASSPPSSQPGEGPPPRKRPRNGVYPHHLSSQHRTSGGLKRPLVTSTASTAAARNSNVSSRTSGSEREDNLSLSPYDSEGTSVSEISVDRAQRLLNGVINGLQHKTRQNGMTLETTTDMAALTASTDHRQSTEASRAQETPGIKYRSLRQVLFVATGRVLDYFFQHKGGYKLSPAERRRNSISSSSVVPANGGNDNTSNVSAVAATEKVGDLSIGEEVFQQRKQRLLSLLSDADESTRRDKESGNISLYMTNPPFTIQRIAEVLLTPDRYYTQTHKLCNCLEKLLLVTSSIQAFGGTTGGDSSQTRREEQEMAALADERGRLMSEYRRKEIKRRMSASSEGDSHMEYNDREHAAASSLQTSREEGLSSLTRGHHRKEEMIGSEASKDDLQKEELLEAARASLRSKFDHVGIDPHSAVANANRERRTGNRSPPPPNLPGSAAGMALAGHAHSGLLRAHHDQEPPGAGGTSLVVRAPSPPMMFQATAEGGSSPKNNSPTAIRPTQQSLQLLHMHHAAVLGGVSPFDLIGLNGGSASAAGAPVAHASPIGSLSAGMMPHMREMDVECRSSASSDIASSDLDSESDDISFDDSASDRSDGSDSGALPSANPAVARALALNRAQQQQQPQRRMLGSATGSAFNNQRGVTPQQSSDPSLTTNNHTGNSSGGRVEAEYQSGDSIDSLRADDSDSSSDMAD